MTPHHRRKAAHQRPGSTNVMASYNYRARPDAGTLWPVECTVEIYAPTKRSEKDEAVSNLLDRLDLERPLANNVRFASRAEPWKYTGGDLPGRP
jgi:hypothetical protein